MSWALVAGTSVAQDLLARPERVLATVEDEAQELADKFGDARRTSVRACGCLSHPAHSTLKYLCTGSTTVVTLSKRSLGLTLVDQ